MIYTQEQMLKLIVTAGAIVFVAVATKVINALVLRPRRLRSQLRKQGILGPPPSFLWGNLNEFRQSNAVGVAQSPQEITHNCSAKLFSVFDRWRTEYGPVQVYLLCGIFLRGPTFMFSLGKIPILCSYDLDIVREITTCTSLDLGKPSYQHKKISPLLGQGILTSNGAAWAHQRKVISPELYPDKVKINILALSIFLILNSWRQMIQERGSPIDITIDKHMGRFSADVISRVCFGSNYAEGEEIFLKMRELQEAVSKDTLPSIFPGLQYIPSKNNREIWKLEKELRSLILDVVKERSKQVNSEKDMLQMILQGAANSDFSEDTRDQFIVDNCKNTYWAGHETTAVSATWTLMLLASSPEWQAKVREEVFEICGGKFPDANMMKKMKVLKMVINESLRLYPPGTVITREALTDMNFGNLRVPKGVDVWALAVMLHQDLQIWGPDAEQFNPERFVNGVHGACKFPQVFMPFGFGPRICLGQTLAISVLKILVAMIISKFSLSLSSKYKHSPKLRLMIEPEFGVDLVVEALRTQASHNIRE